MEILLQGLHFWTETYFDWLFYVPIVIVCISPLVFPMVNNYFFLEFISYPSIRIIMHNIISLKILSYGIHNLTDRGNCWILEDTDMRTNAIIHSIYIWAENTCRVLPHPLSKPILLTLNLLGSFVVEGEDLLEAINQARLASSDNDSAQFIISRPGI